MNALHKKRSPGRTRARAENRKAFDVRQQYTGLSPFVNPHSCWFCNYINGHMVGSPPRRRMRSICQFHGHATRPARPGCEFFMVGGAP
jgi:hypothetical protein